MQDIQSLPLMKSTHVCNQEINSNGIISLSECQETHVFRPFSRHESGARTQVTSKLTFYRQTAGVTSRNGNCSIDIKPLVKPVISCDLRD